VRDFLGLSQLPASNGGLGGLLAGDLLSNMILAIKIQDGVWVSTFRMNRYSSFPGIPAYVTVFTLRLLFSYIKPQ
jgi:Na+/H+ antiporter NhaC